ncbi:MAG: glycosyltransferase family 2 protein [Candidatus Omnitrophica bacterium]|nr:glycosyltransferase family 2 protein [Candidatus Omnitrophota bacterium]
MIPVPLSIIVCVKNEEKRLHDCLKSVYGWAKEIVIIDDESTDKTVEIAKQYTDRILFRKMDIEGVHRNWANDQGTCEWALVLDADEILTEELKKEIEDELANPQADVYGIPHRNYIGDYWLQYGGQYPAPQLRLFRKGHLKSEEVEVHPIVRATGKVKFLTKDTIHKSYRDFTHYLTKLNNQTTAEATKMFKSNKKFTFGKYFWRAVDRFFRTYVAKKGYKDGLIGFMVAFFNSAYQIISYAKYWEMTQKKQS